MNVEEILKTTKPIPIISRTLIHLSLVSNKITEQLNGTLKPFEVSPQQYNVLRILRGQKGKPANLSTLNERMITKMSNTTRLVDKLIAKDLVKRTVCKENRRKVEIFITQKGLEQLAIMDKAVNDVEQKMTQQLSQNDLETFNNLLDKF